MMAPTGKKPESLFEDREYERDLVQKIWPILKCLHCGLEALAKTSSCSLRTLASASECVDRGNMCTAMLAWK